MKKVAKVFNVIFKFLDKIIFMPLTRLVARIGNKLSAPNKRIETWLSKQTTLLFISLFVAVAIFIVVDRKIINFSVQTAEVFKDQPIKILYNEEQYIIEGLPEKVDVTLIGSKADLYIAKQSSNNGVTVDLTGLAPGTHKINIRYDQGLSGIEYSVNPAVATVRIYKKVSDARTLSYDIVNSNKLGNTLVVSDVSLSASDITIRGAEYKINQVATVKALIDIDDLPKKEIGTQPINDVSLKAYDTDGNVVDVEFVPSKLSATVELSSPSKSVPLNLILEGQLQTGKAIKSYTLSQNEVTIYGDSETLQAIESLDVVADISNVTGDTSFKAEIKKPVGVKYLSESYVNIDLKVTETSVEPIKFTIALTGKNLGEGLIAQPIDDENGFITVEVQGAETVLASITESDIVVYVDLSEEKEEGTYTKPIYVQGNNQLATYKAKRTEATVVISKKN